MLHLILYIGLPTLLLLVYTQQYVDIALIKRKLHRLTFEKKELTSRNQALREALGRLASKSGLRYWQSFQELAPHQKNKIVRIKLPIEP